MSSPTGPFHLLSRDCWEEILEYLPVEDRSALSRTCKAIRASTEPSVYHTITVNWIWPHPRVLLQLLRTFFARPELASRVHHVNISRQENIDWDWAYPGHMLNWPRQQTVFIDVVDKAIDIIQRARFPDAEDWIQALYAGDSHVFGAVLISQLHGLRTLRLDYSFVWLGGYPGRMVRHALLGSVPDNVLSRFEALRLVDYGGNVPPAETYSEPVELEEPEGFPSVYDRDQFAGWFYLPALQHLAIWLREITELKQPQQPECKCNLGNLRSLVLARSTIAEEDVLFLLGQTKTLRDLHLGLAYSCFNERVLQKGDLVAQALECVSETVEKLSVGLDYYPYGYGEYHGDENYESLYDPFHGFLKRFHRLQSAEIPVTMLLGFNPEDGIDLRSVLPGTLRELGLRNDLKSVFENEWHQLDIHERVQDLLPEYREVTPFLSHIYLRLWSGTYGGYWPADEEELQVICAEAGVHLDIVVDNLLPGFGSYSHFRF